MSLGPQIGQLNERPGWPAAVVTGTMWVSRWSGKPLAGTVESIVAGIADRDRATSSNLLPTVNPTFNWVRLAQRVPVRVKLDPVPDDVKLVAGQTVTVEVTGNTTKNAESAKTTAAAPEQTKG